MFIVLKVYVFYNGFDTDSDIVPNSVQSIEIDLDDDLGFSNESDTESNVRNCDIENLLEQVDNLSNNESAPSDNSDIDNDQKDLHENHVPEVQEPMEDNDTDDLCVDLDELGSNPQTGDKMFDILQKDPEWLDTFLPLHVNQFTQPTGPKLPEHFETETALPL